MGYEPINLPYFSTLNFFDYILVYGARWLMMLDGNSVILLHVMQVVLLHILSYHDSPLVRLIICGFVLSISTGTEFR